MRDSTVPGSGGSDGSGGSGGPGAPREVEISGEMIRLGQLLKFANLIDAGSEAKDLLAEDQVRVDGEIEVRRGRQLVRGMIVTVGEGRHAESVKLV